MRQARARRIGKWLAQELDQCWLASVCIAMGYKYSRARQERYMSGIMRSNSYGGVTEADLALQGSAIRRIWEQHAADVTKQGYSSGRVDVIPSDAHGIISMYTRSYQHSIAVIDGKIVCPDHPEDLAHTYTYAEWCKLLHMRPTLVIYQELRP